MTNSCNTPDICDTGYDVKGEKSPYYTRSSKVPTKPGCWDYNLVEIIDRSTEDVIGSYTRNYSTMYRTFHPFFLRGKWYALYSPNYTATRIMSLPDCKDIGGEKPDGFGFCPVDFYVPVLDYLQFVHDAGCPRQDGDMRKPPCTCDPGHLSGCPLNGPHPKIMPNGGYDWDSCICKEQREKWDKTHHIWHYPDRIHGFVAGCIWGDDSSWKIQHLDLSKADEGILTRTAKFGYIELPRNLDLCTAVDLDVDGYNGKLHYTLKIASESYYDIDGEKKNE